MVDPTAYDVLCGFAHALSHRLRGPLSIIQNDLLFLQTKCREEDFTRPLGKCGKVVSLLKESTPPNHTSLWALTDIGMVVQDCAAARNVRCESASGEQIAIYADEALLRASFDRLFHLLTKLAATPASVRIDTGGGQCFFVLIQALTDIEWEGEGSLSRSLCSDAGLDAIEAPIAEAILLAHGIKCRCSVSRGLLLISVTGTFQP